MAKKASSAGTDIGASRHRARTARRYSHQGGSRSRSTAAVRGAAASGKGCAAVALAAGRGCWAPAAGEGAGAGRAAAGRAPAAAAVGGAARGLSGGGEPTRSGEAARWLSGEGAGEKAACELLALPARGADAPCLAACAIQRYLE